MLDVDCVFELSKRHPLSYHVHCHRPQYLQSYRVSCASTDNQCRVWYLLCMHTGCCQDHLNVALLAAIFACLLPFHQTVSLSGGYLAAPWIGLLPLVVHPLAFHVCIHFVRQSILYRELVTTVCGSFRTIYSAFRIASNYATWLDSTPINFYSRCYRTTRQSFVPLNIAAPYKFLNVPLWHFATLPWYYWRFFGFNVCFVAPCRIGPVFVFFGHCQADVGSHRTFWYIRNIIL